MDWEDKGDIREVEIPELNKKGSVCWPDSEEVGRGGCLGKGNGVCKGVEVGILRHV